MYLKKIVLEVVIIPTAYTQARWRQVSDFRTFKKKCLTSDFGVNNHRFIKSFIRHIITYQIQFNKCSVNAFKHRILNLNSNDFMNF